MMPKILIATLFGLVIGMAFVIGRWTVFALNAPVVLETAEHGEQRLKAVQEELKLTYYSELLKKPSQEAPEPEPEAPVTPVAPPVPVASDKASPDRMATALAKVLGNETPDAVKTVIKQSLPIGTGSPFAIQVASLPNRKSADEMVQRLLGKGFRAKLVQADIPGKGSMYRVRIHGFKTREEADKYREEKQIEGITVGQ